VRSLESQTMDYVPKRMEVGDRVIASRRGLQRLLFDFLRKTEQFALFLERPEGVRSFPTTRPIE